MPSLPCLQTLQRELADSIIRCAPLDDIRILLACGAKVNEPVTQGIKPFITSIFFHLIFSHLFSSLILCLCYHWLWSGLRPLHYATYQRYTEAVNLLLVRGSDVDAMDDVGYTALHLCAERGYTDLMRMLLDHGARVKFTELKPDDKVID